MSKINQPYITNKATAPVFTPKDNKQEGLKKNHRTAPWTKEEIVESTEKHVVYTWGATDPMRNSSIAF